ncbi:MAG: ParB/RepB/Spo0J family partition protein [Planctomycetota bacterium]|nr:ParB/RepB/Spo0J family partition protein [Planctomycetota bacterium]
MVTRTKAPPVKNGTPIHDRRPVTNPPKQDKRGPGGYIPVQIAIDRIDPNPLNTREHFDQERLQSLAESLDDVCLLHPVDVRPLGMGRFQLIDGERRWRAAELAGWKTIPAFVYDVTDATAITMMVAENLQREELNAIEKAKSFELLTKPVEEGGAGLNQSEVAQRLRLSRPVVCNTLRLLKLPARWQQKVVSGELIETKARSLAAYSDRPEILAAIEKDMEANPQDWLSNDFQDSVNAIVDVFDKLNDPDPEEHEYDSDPASDLEPDEDYQDEATLSDPGATRATSNRARHVDHVSPTAAVRTTEAPPEKPRSDVVTDRIIDMLSDVRTIADIDRLLDSVTDRRKAIMNSDFRDRMRPSGTATKGRRV